MSSPYPSDSLSDAFKTLGLEESDIRHIVETLDEDLHFTPVHLCPLTPPSNGRYSWPPWFIHPWCEGKKKRPPAIKFRFYKCVLTVAIAESYRSFLQWHIRDDTPILYDLVMLDQIDIVRLQSVFTERRDTLWKPTSENGSNTVTEVLYRIWMNLNKEPSGFSPSKKANTREPTEDKKQIPYPIKANMVNRLMYIASNFYIPAISAVLHFKKILPEGLRNPTDRSNQFMGPNAMLVTEDANSIYHRNRIIAVYVNMLINEILIDRRTQQEENEEYGRGPPPQKVRRTEPPEPPMKPPPLNNGLKRLQNARIKLEMSQLAMRREPPLLYPPHVRYPYPSVRYPYPHGGKRTKRERKNRKRHTQRRK